MRREIVVQLVLTAIALLLLLFVIFFHPPTYVEEFPEDVSPSVEMTLQTEPSSTLPADEEPLPEVPPPGDAETVYKP